MTLAYLRKLPGGYIPEDASNEPGVFDSIKNNEVIKIKFVRPRNYERHKKYFALLNIAFDAFEPNTMHKGVLVDKNFERFRKDVIVQAGHYDVVVNINGELRLEAKSIRFSKMSEEEFNDLYNKSVNVILQKVLTTYTKADLDHIVEQVIRF
ncbi:MAG: DUF1367 family protein [Paraglaciecola sp.]|nr:DUF1367 family protein [Paraglaciecola sp.]